MYDVVFDPLAIDFLNSLEKEVKESKRGGITLPAIDIVVVVEIF